MWKPDQSLDDYIVRPAPEVTSEPPSPVELQRTGEVEVLKPLTRLELRSRSVRTVRRLFRPSSSVQPLWFRRFLAVGSGALVMIALVLVSAILVSINDPAAGPDIATGEMPVDELAQPEAPFSSDIISASAYALATGGIDIVRSSTRRWSAGPSIHLTANKPRRQIRPLPQAEQPKFVPTTLVIYAENGVIYSRVEPWFQTEDKKTPTFNN